MTTFEQAMLARDRTLAVRVGKYNSSDINEAAFSYGYIAGDTFKPGGTCAGSGKIIFSSIITTFKKLDKIYPEIGLLVDDNYEWIKMGEYFINDIKIDRNRSKTELELMDGMFKFNQPYVSALNYPAQIRDVIREICEKTGVDLQTDDLGLRAIQQHIPKKPDKKDITFREVLSQAVQLLGFSAFFNRDGKLEIRGLTESSITITADNYFLHGLTKSETEYQIAGITCKKKDKEILTAGLRTGRSLELENSFMNQNILDDLYYDLKNLKYYPFNLNYQGHLKLQVGQWVTIKTNKNETFRVPVLSQSFNFKGGLSSRISADSKAGSDTQYNYSGFVRRQINQVATDIEAEVQQQLERAEKEFDKKQNGLKDEIKSGIEQAKAKAEEVKSEINQSIEQKLQQTKSEVVEKVKQDFNQGLANANSEIGKVKQDLTNLQSSSEATITQLKSDLASQLGDKASKSEVKQTADGIREEISKISVGARNLLPNTDFKKLVDIGKQFTVNGKTYKVKTLDKWYNSYNEGIPNPTTNYHGFFNEEKFNETVFEFNESNGVREWKGMVIFFTNDSRFTVGKYVFSADVNATALGTHLEVGFYYYNKAGVRYFHAGLPKKDVTSVNAWSRISLELKINDDVDFTKEMGFYIYGYPFTTNSILYLKRPKLEKGTLATDWNPAPEDTDEQITAARTTFEKTAEGLKTDMTAVKSYVEDDSKRREQLEQYTRTETARSTEALRKQVSENYVAKSQYSEDVRGITRKFEELRVGGTNLFKGSRNFDKELWDYNPYKNTPISERVDDMAVISADYLWGGLSQLIEVRAGETYTFSFWALSNQDNDQVNIYIPLNDWITKPKATVDSGSKTIVINKAWSRISFTFKVLSDGFIAPRLERFDANGILKYRGFKLERGAISSDWSPAPKDGEKYAETKLAEYKQTVDGEFKKIQSSVGEMVKKTDINITPGQISFGTGKVVNGKTIASFFVQNPESIEAITKLMRITGDLIVNGSITGQNLASKTITTANLAAGSVTTEVLAADAVTAKNMRVDYALIDKLTADDALLNNLVTKQAFINKLSTIDLSATQIKGGLLKSLNDATTFDLTTGDIIFSDTEPSILRKKSGYPHGVFSMTNSIYEDEKAVRITLGAGNIKDSTGSDPWRDTEISLTNTTSKTKGSTIAIRSGDEIYLYTEGKIFLNAQDDLLTGKNGKGFSIYTLKRCVDFILDKTDLKNSWDSQEEWWGK
ncbi:hypothetical protein [Streptococcus intermedius]|uniref:hypothetical protein n=1 Tax=Streptococcus intermedius TaxID=1338 RepID=UPI0019670E57|nr:hypothetical protein [Streptococcus intermedius]